MHPYLAERLGRERLARLLHEAEQSRVAAAAVRRRVPSRQPGRVRAALGERLVRVGLRLAGPEATLIARMGE